MPVTVEDNDGNLINSKAFIVSLKYKTSAGFAAVTGGGAYYVKGRKVVINSDIPGDWNVRIKSAEIGCTININIVNTHTADVTIGNKFYKGHNVDAQTTGYFENLIYEPLK